MTPHARHLAEMRADRPEPPTPIAAVPCRALTGAALQAARARYAADREAERLRQCYPDPTRRHLMEMRMSREVRRAATIAALAAATGRPAGEDVDGQIGEVLALARVKA